MTFLYNCKHSGDQFRITKFDSDWNVESSYLCDFFACECLAGHRSSCRHRDMLSKFIARDAVGTEWFWDHDRGGWVQGASSELTAQKPEQPALEIVSFVELPADSTSEEVANAFAGLDQANEPSPSPSPTIRRRV